MLLKEQFYLDSMNIERNRIYCGDCFKLIKELPDNSIDCIVTSPPYWALRDYGFKNQIGLEEHPEKYIEKIVAFMKEAKRVIKPTGTIFLNLGDSFYTRSGGFNNRLSKLSRLLNKNSRLSKAYTETRGKFKTNWLQSKQKLLIPYRVAIKCQDELGLILRNDIHWVKQLFNVKSEESFGSSVPNPVKDRFNTNSESIFFFVKSRKYFFDLDAIRAPYKESSINRGRYLRRATKNSPYAPQVISNRNKISFNELGKNPGDCLHFSYEPRREKHFAMFPLRMPIFFIKCGCPKGGLVLDPFIGSGTTATACVLLEREFIGFDANKKYCKVAEKFVKTIKFQRQEGFHA